MRSWILLSFCALLSACAHHGDMTGMDPDADPSTASQTITTTGRAINDLNAYRMLKDEHPELFIWHKAQEINHDVNEHISYRSDPPQNTGYVEVWHVMPTGGEGNCHDYAVTKLAKMIDAGVPRESLRLTVASVKNTGEWHLMLAVDVPDRGTFFMDSNRENILTAEEARDLYTLWFMENPRAERFELVGNA